jgi:putative peptide zinc metalloprotease protein
VGGRVYVRFDHGREPLYYRWHRVVRELLLKRFNV